MEKNILQELVKEGNSTYSIAKELNISQTNVRYWLDKHSLKTKPNSTKKYKCYECLNCGEAIYDSKAKRKFCNSSCNGEHTIKQSIKKLEKGISVSSNTIRNALKFKDGHVCQICKISLWEGSPVPLVADHIDGNPYNDNIKNLRLICCNCDAQTPTFKGRNVGKGRHVRRERYKEGKSY